MKRSISLVFVFAAAFSAAGLSETAYRLPPKEITQIIDTAPTPEVVVSPARNAMLLVDYEGYPPIAFVSQPMLRLAGLRVAPDTSSRQRIRRSGLSTVRRPTASRFPKGRRSGCRSGPTTGSDWLFPATSRTAWSSGRWTPPRARRAPSPPSD